MPMLGRGAVAGPGAWNDPGKIPPIHGRVVYSNAVAFARLLGGWGGAICLPAQYAQRLHSPCLEPSSLLTLGCDFLAVDC
jgi:hypothetical protein